MSGARARNPPRPGGARIPVRQNGSMTSATDLHGDAHVQRYLETIGEDGYTWRNGTSILILFTQGRKSGEPRSHALIFQPYGDDYLVVASKGGTPEPPAWYLNLQADPEVEVQIKGDRFTAHARTATPEEKPAMWATMTAVWPDYDEYQKKTSREIPVVVLKRA
jgi:deazaflavin-dependent oxidoreductase (nitroreductase family)